MSQLLVLSAVFHLGVALVFGWNFRPHGSVSSTETPKTAAMVYELRSEPVTPHLVPSARVKSELVVAHAAPIAKVASAKAHEMASAAPAPALTLKDKAHLNLAALPAMDSTPLSGAECHDGIVFLLDISGSMYEPYESSTRLALARELMAQRITSLKDGAAFAVVVYGETARESGPLVRATATSRQAAIRFIGQNIDCGGGTNLPAGLAAATALQAGAILLVTDGELNTTGGELLPKAHEILGSPGAGPALTVVAIGPRPHTEAEHLLHGLVDQQNGTYQTDLKNDVVASLTPPKVEGSIP